MTEFTLVVANKNYSSWSLRGWLALKLTGVAFDEVVVPDAIPLSRLAPYGATPDKVFRYPGLKEEYYLADFEPGTAILDELGIDADVECTGQLVVATAPWQLDALRDDAALLRQKLNAPKLNPGSPAQLLEALKAAGIALEVVDTGAACRIYNVLLAESRKVGAALIPL